MEVYEKIEPLKLRLKELREMNMIVGFVPTMGALHNGHLSLLQKSKQENDISVVSIFVNPTQFNNPTDLAKYPRVLDKDLSFLRNAHCNIVFVPQVSEMYPQSDTRIFDFDYLDKILEGEFRPGHFNGVAQVVSKLFEIVKADNAYFGKKDFQQLAIIKELAKKYMPDLRTRIHGCETIREADGLAMSSRNLRLNAEQRESALKISQSLFKSKEMFEHDKSLAEIKHFVNEYISADPILRMEYFEILDADTLKSISENDFKTNIVACIAVYSGEIRLIDNITF
jgi:pantoate--beta-alanine ligase